jgi:hypothetical protein
VLLRVAKVYAFVNNNAIRLIIWALRHPVSGRVGARLSAVSFFLPHFDCAQ